jgi:preprotein translocase subunit SecY
MKVNFEKTGDLVIDAILILWSSVIAFIMTYEDYFNSYILFGTAIIITIRVILLTTELIKKWKTRKQAKDLQ